MNERFTYLVEKFMDNNLEASEIPEFEKFLDELENQEYLRKAEFANKIIKQGLSMLTEKEKREILDWKPEGGGKEQECEF